jgi:hypothetical protein
MMDLSGNIIGVNHQQNINHSATATATGFAVTGTVGGQTGPGPGPVDPVYPVHIESVINMVVGERDICNITHEQIGEGHRYMSCSNCDNNYSEIAIVTWLRKKPQWSRTCPTCRSIWDNYCVYVNEPLD